MDLRELAAQFATESAEPSQATDGAAYRSILSDRPGGPPEDPRQDALLQREQEQRAAAEARALEICKEYQDNATKSAGAQASILKGIKTGENPYKLLLAACECIGRLTSNKAFREQAGADIEAVAGRGLLYPEALEIELEGIQRRLAMLTRPELDREPESSRRRITAAIRAHQQRAGEIEKVLRDRSELIERERLAMAERTAKLKRMETDPEYRAKVEAERRATLGLIS